MSHQTLEFPYAVFATPDECLTSIQDAADHHDWWRTANIHAQDERVLWTIHHDRITLHYRQKEVA